jgi:hypothetical protein
MKIVYYDRTVYTQELMEDCKKDGAMMKEYHNGDIEALCYTIHQLSEKNQELQGKVNILEPTVELLAPFEGFDTGCFRCDGYASACTVDRCETGEKAKFEGCGYHG